MDRTPNDPVMAGLHREWYAGRYRRGETVAATNRRCQELRERIEVANRRIELKEHPWDQSMAASWHGGRDKWIAELEACEQVMAERLAGRVADHASPPTAKLVAPAALKVEPVADTHSGVRPVT